MPRCRLKTLKSFLLGLSPGIVIGVSALLLVLALHLSSVADNFLTQNYAAHQKTRAILKINLIFQRGFAQALAAIPAKDRELLDDSLDLIEASIGYAGTSQYIPAENETKLNGTIRDVQALLEEAFADQHFRQGEARSSLLEANAKAAEIFSLLSAEDAQNWTRTKASSAILDRQFTRARYYMAFWTTFMVLVSVIVVSVLRARKKARMDLQRANASLERRVEERTSELSAAYQILQEKSRQLQTIINAIPAPIYYQNEQGIYLGCNEAFEKFIGLPLKRIVGRTAYDIAPKDLADLYYRADQALLRRGGIQVYESSVVYADETRHDVLFHKATFRTGGETGGLVGTLVDITERKAAEREVEQLAYFDSLTGLPNRTLLARRLEEQLARSDRDGTMVGVLFLDQQHFKNINQTLGYATGNRILQAIGERMTECAPAGETVARVGGVKFAMSLCGLADEHQAARVAERVLRSLARPVETEGRSLYCTGSVGIALSSVAGDNVESLLANAEAAMYQARDQGKNNYRFYSSEMSNQAMERLELETSLRRALERNEFSLHYQPQVDLASGRLIGVETLLRWRNPSHGMISPAKFVPILEDTGLIQSVGAWVLETACRQNKAWQEEGYEPIRVSVNLSGLQLKQPGICDMVAEVLKKTDLAPRWLELELTETIMMENTEENIHTLNGFKALGVHLSIDDFGTGYSSLGYLKRFPIDELKIDRSFVRDILTNPDDAAIAEAIIAMAHSLGLKVVAEGVETMEQLEFLKARRCDQSQGYLFGRPMVAAEILPFLRPLPATESAASR